MVSIRKEFEDRASKCDLDVNEKVKFRKMMKDLKIKDSKASVFGIIHLITELLFFWSILAAAIIGANEAHGENIPGFMRGYMGLVVSFFQAINIYTLWAIPYSFIAMMVVGNFLGNAERARTKAVTGIISLLTFAEQKSLLFQMQDYVDKRMDEVKRDGEKGGRKANQTTYFNPKYATQ